MFVGFVYFIFFCLAWFFVLGVFPFCLVVRTANDTFWDVEEGGEGGLGARSTLKLAKGGNEKRGKGCDARK